MDYPNDDEPVHANLPNGWRVVSSRYYDDASFRVQGPQIVVAVGEKW